MSRKGFLYGGTTTLPEHCDGILESRKDFKEIKEEKTKDRGMANKQKVQKGAMTLFLYENVCKNVFNM